MSEVIVERLGVADAPELLEGILRSRCLHRPWVEPPSELEALQEYLSAPEDRYTRFAIRNAQGSLAAVINVNAIIRGAFHCGFLGFYALYPHHARGLVYAGMQKVIGESFGALGLHRLEANIQPANSRSVTLVKSLGFCLEGHSPRYLKIGGEWRDHDRYALTSEQVGQASLLASASDAPEVHDKKRFILLMHGDATRQGREDEWDAYFQRLTSVDGFCGGSAMGGGACLRKEAEAGQLHDSIVGYIVVSARDLKDAKALVAGNPVFEAGGTVEVRELPPG